LNLLNSNDKVNVSNVNDKDPLNHSNIIRNNSTNTRKLIENKIKENSQNRKNENIISSSFFNKKN
jgi:hypothetical protein